MSHIQRVIAPAVLKLTSSDVALSSQERATALDECDKVKKSPEGVRVSLRFFQDFAARARPAPQAAAPQDELTRNEPLQHFMLQVLLHGVVYNWGSYSEEQKAQIKEQVLPLLLAFCATGPAAYLIQKAADIIAEVAKREWPQQWPAFHRQLLAMASDGGPHAVRGATAVLANLSEDCTSLDYQLQLPPKRRAQVREGLRIAHAELVAFLLKFASFAVSKQSAGGDSAQFSGAALRLVLRALRSFVQWLPFDAVREGHASLWPFLLTMCSTARAPELQQRALLVVLALCERSDFAASKFKVAEHQVLFTKVVACCCRYHASVGPPGNSEEERRGADVALRKTLALLCSRCFEPLLFNQSNFVAANAECVSRFLQLSLSLSAGGHPSMHFPLDVLRAFATNVLPLIDAPPSAAQGLVMHHAGATGDVRQQSIAAASVSAASSNESGSNQLMYKMLSQIAPNVLASSLDLYYFAERMRRLVKPQVGASNPGSADGEIVYNDEDLLRLSIPQKLAADRARLAWFDLDFGDLSALDAANELYKVCVAVGDLVRWRAESESVSILLMHCHD